MDTVYDTTVIACSNQELAERQLNPELNRRLDVIEQFITAERTAWYNDKLLKEYVDHLGTNQNDVIHMFMMQLADRGIWCKRYSLSRQHHAVAQEAGWPNHDQHLLAAAIEGHRTTIFVTEDLHANCAKKIKREFKISVEQV